MQITLPLFVAAATAFVPFQHAPDAKEAHAAAQATYAAAVAAQHELLQAQEHEIRARAEELAAAAQEARRDSETLRHVFEAARIAQSAQGAAELTGKLELNQLALNQLDVAHVQREVAEQAAQLAQGMRAARRQDVDLESMELEQLLELQKRVNEQLQRRGEHHTGKTTFWNATPAPRGQASGGSVNSAPRVNILRPSTGGGVVTSKVRGEAPHVVKVDGENVEVERLEELYQPALQDGSARGFSVRGRDGESAVDIVRTAPARRAAVAVEADKRREARRKLETELQMLEMEASDFEFEMIELEEGSKIAGVGKNFFHRAPAQPAPPAPPAPSARPTHATPPAPPSIYGRGTPGGFFAPSRAQGAPKANLDEVTDLVRDMVHEIRDLRAAVEELRERVQAQSF